MFNDCLLSVVFSYIVLQKNEIFFWLTNAYETIEMNQNICNGIMNIMRIKNIICYSIGMTIIKMIMLLKRSLCIHACTMHDVQDSIRMTIVE